LVRQLTQHYVLTLLRSCLEGGGGKGARGRTLSALQQVLTLLTTVCEEKKVVLGANFYQLYVSSLIDDGSTGGSDAGIAAGGSSGAELR
jgi:hypothetical protein